MAYCVHCGVKLGEGERACPLCGTEAKDPTTPFDESAPKRFPVRTSEQTLKVSRRYAISLLSLLLLVPAGICLLIDLIGGGITWSLYPAGVLVLTWIAVSMPLLIRRHRLYSTILITGVTLAGYLYLVEQVTGTQGWFLPVVLPALALAIAMMCLTVWVVRGKRLRLLRLMGLLLMEVGLLCLAIEGLCMLQGSAQAFTWSPFVIIPCFFIALVLYVISRSAALSTELKRRFHF